MTESTEPTSDGVRKKELREAGINAGIALVSILAILSILIWIDLTPLPAQRPFTRVGGETRVETAIEVSRMWPMSSNQAFVPVRSAGGQEVYWSGAECAVWHEPGPLPLLLGTNDEPRATAITRAAAYLGGRPVPAASCARTRRVVGAPCEQSLWNVLEVPGDTYPVRLPGWVPGCEQLHSTVIFAAVKSSRDAPDLAVALPLARQLSAPNRGVTVVVTPPYLEANPPLSRFLSQSEETVESGIILGSTTRIPEATQAQLADLLNRQEDAAWLQRLATGLGPFGTLLIALLTLLSGWKVAQASTPIAEAVGIGMETRVKPFFERGKDRSDDSGSDAERTSSPEASDEGGVSATPAMTLGESTPAGDVWDPASLNAQRVGLRLKSGEVVIGTLDVEPVDLASIRFLRVTDVRLERTRAGYSEEKLAILLVPWSEVLMVWQPENEVDSQDSSPPVAHENDMLSKHRTPPGQ